MIEIQIPNFTNSGKLEVKWVVTDFTGTHAFGGKLRDGVRDRLIRLAKSVEIHVITSDTFGTVQRELEGIPHELKLLGDGERHDIQKLSYVVEGDFDLRQVAAFGNGNNDRYLLKAVKDGGGLAVAVDNGEGCALDAMLYLFTALLPLCSESAVCRART